MQPRKKNKQRPEPSQPTRQLSRPSPGRRPQGVESSPLTSLPTEGDRSPGKRKPPPAIAARKPQAMQAKVTKWVNWVNSPEKKVQARKKNNVIQSSEDKLGEGEDEGDDEEDDNDAHILDILDTEQREELLDERQDNDYEPSDEELSFQANLMERNKDYSPPVRGKTMGTTDQRPGFPRAQSVPAVPVTPTPSKGKRKAASQQSSPVPDDEEEFSVPDRNRFTAALERASFNNDRGVLSEAQAEQMWAYVVAGSQKQAANQPKKQRNEDNSNPTHALKPAAKLAKSRHDAPSNASRSSQPAVRLPASNRDAPSKVGSVHSSQHGAKPAKSKSGHDVPSNVSRSSQPAVRLPASNRDASSKASLVHSSQQAAKPAKSGRGAPSKASTSNGPQPDETYSSSNSVKNQRLNQQQIVLYQSDVSSRSPSPPAQNPHLANERKKRPASSGDKVDIDAQRDPKRRKLPNMDKLAIARRLQGDYGDDDEEQEIDLKEHSDSSDEGGAALVPQSRRAQRTTKDPMPHHLRFYDAITQIYLKNARTRFMLYLMSDDAYIAGEAFDTLVTKSLKKASIAVPNAYEQSTVTKINGSIRKMFVCAGDEIRGKIHTAASKIVLTVYGIIPQDGAPVSAAVISQIVSGLLCNHNYVLGTYRRSNKATVEDVFYCHPAISAVILQVFFNNKPSGTYIRRLTPMPWQLIAFVCAGLKCALDEWANGSYKMITFSQDNYRETYVWHRAWWQACQASTPVIYHNIAKRLSDYCIAMSGVRISSDEKGIGDQTEEQLQLMLLNGPNIPGWTKPIDDDVMDAND